MSKFLFCVPLEAHTASFHSGRRRWRASGLGRAELENIIQATASRIHPIVHQVQLAAAPGACHMGVPMISPLSKSMPSQLSPPSSKLPSNPFFADIALESDGVLHPEAGRL